MEKRLADDAGGRRKGEKGAALMLALLISLLLLLVGGALITNTMLSATNMNDATPEVQAYYGAESGLQAAMLALRGNASPTPLFTPNPSGSVDSANKLDFRGAVTNSISNLSSESASSYSARLSRWIQYNYPTSGFADRVTVSSGTYSPISGIAYSLRVTDPDNSSVVTYSTSGVFNNGTTSVLLGTSTNGATLTYSNLSSTSVTAYPTATAQSVSLGSFTLTKSGTGTGTFSVPSSTQITLRVAVSAPYSGYMLVGGTLTGSVTMAAGIVSASALKLTFANPSLRVRGTLFTFADYSSGTTITSTYSIGYTTGFSPSPFPLRVKIDAPNPERLLVASTGYGPRGSRKQLTMEVNKFVYNIRPPAPIVIRGSEDGTTATFDLGSSNAKYYTGKDHAGVQAQQPTVAIDMVDWTVVNNGLTKGSTIADPKLSILDVDTIPSPWASPSPVPSSNPVGQQPSTPPAAQTPDFLVSASAARTFLNDLQTVAQNNSRYYSSLSGYADSGNNAANVNNPALTFVDGNCTLDGGSGLLVVTGTLTINGNDDFRGLILVMGTGKVVRSGGGNGKVYGAWIVAAFSRSGTGGFTAPYFDVSGGGNSRFEFDTNAIDDALHVLGLKVTGVAET